MWLFAKIIKTDNVNCKLKFASEKSVPEGCRIHNVV
jgi:hypothetical protein